MTVKNIGPCASCGLSIFMSEEHEKILRQNQGSFYCLWGHSNVWPKTPTEAREDVLRRERDRLKQDAARLHENIARQAERAETAERRARAARGQVTRLKNRAAAGVCPCCNRQFQNLRRHMDTKHKGFLVEEIQAAVGETIQ